MCKDYGKVRCPDWFIVLGPQYHDKMFARVKNDGDLLVLLFLKANGMKEIRVLATTLFSMIFSWYFLLHLNIQGYDT